MAKAEISAKVSLEKIIHNGLRDLIQNFWDEQKILIYAVNVEWIDLSTSGKRGYKITDINLKTLTIDGFWDPSEHF